VDDAPRHVLVAPSGLSVVISALGATLVGVRSDDRDGTFDDVVLGFDCDADYRANPGLYFGATIGRVANRIRGAAFDLGGRRWKLAANDGRNHLHGGPACSFDRRVWEVGEVVDSGPTQSVSLHLESPELEEGYPGRVEVTVRYTVGPTDELLIEYAATASEPTPLSLTNHAYWNLGGHGAGSILGHELQVRADRYTPADEELIVTGEVRPLDGTPIDFRAGARIGARIAELETAGARGYDHNLVLETEREPGLPDAVLFDPRSGRVLEVETDRPCLQVYSGNFMGDLTGKGGAVYGHRGAICLEPQGYPDAVNQPSFPSIIITPETGYRAMQRCRFGVR
jgi:aldose 1-epimerase